MSELAFNINGERFTPPVSATNWRVRRLKPGGRGAPDVVFGDDGAPLTPPIETDLAEFRRLVDREPGRYRLDPVDESGRLCEDAIPAYLQLREGADGVAGESRERAGGRGGDDLMKELLRANTEMVRAMADKFASVMDAAASLLKAADGAGMPARQPPPPPEMGEEDDDEEEDYEDPPRSELAELIEVVGPLIAAHFGGGKSTDRKPDGASGGSGVAAAPAGAGAAAGEPPRNRDGAAGKSAGPAPKMPPGALAHFAAIQQRLTPEEARLARAAAKELSPAEIQGWMTQLSALSIDDAVALIRKTIAGPGAPAATERSSS